MSGRFAPSPTAGLHLGNLRTAVMAWCAARAAGVEFVVRVEDLLRIPESRRIEEGQLADLAALGIRSDRPVLRQSERSDFYLDAIADLERRGLVYECYCTRAEIAAEIAAAASAPHGLRADHYPGTCSQLSDAERRRRREEGRRPAVRIRANSAQVGGVDLVAGEFTGVVDDFVIRRGDGVAAYNLAVVLDDAAQGITQVVRGEDLLATTPRQLFLQSVLDLPTPSYAHIALVVGPDGQRLAKRHGSVTLGDLRATGRRPGQVMAALLQSTGLVGEHLIPSALVEEIAAAPEGVDLDRVGRAVRDIALGFSDGVGLDWKVTPFGPVHLGTL